jgi:hypothetical protein
MDSCVLTGALSSLFVEFKTNADAHAHVDRRVLALVAEAVWWVFVEIIGSTLLEAVGWVVFGHRPRSPRSDPKVLGDINPR